MSFSRIPLLPFVWIYLSQILCFGQSPRADFRWEWNKSQELTSQDRIVSSKTLSPSQREGLVIRLVSELRHDVPNLTSKEREEIARQTRIRPIELSSSGGKEFVAQAVDSLFCSPTGNCDFWVFAKRGNAYSVILHRGSIQTFTVQSTRTNGFHDIVLGMHGSATEQGLTLYRFNGSSYRPAGCFDADWEVLDEDQESHLLEEPRVKPCSTR
jgi:hypothetical protein